ncbi:unnamed protein product [Cladocopium goreaui]|uniref:ATP-dependent RNA helicase n=1 Tax=Cladocopium goreaui TaxID=2562237 RepID=A0A9P1DK06_9DINO|nr:unnamed protein product [Cladocopium goreaui]
MDESEHLLKLRALLAPKAQDEAPTKKRKVEEVEGPDWTSRYCVVDAAAALTPLDALAVPLAEPMLEALKKNGFDPLFPIQAMVIPLLLKCAEAADDEDSAYCCDVCVAAPTGQGKTLAYAVPIVQAKMPYRALEDCVAEPPTSTRNACARVDFSGNLDHANHAL